MSGNACRLRMRNAPQWTAMRAYTRPASAGETLTTGGRSDQPISRTPAEREPGKRRLRKPPASPAGTSRSLKQANATREQDRASGVQSPPPSGSDTPGSRHGTNGRSQRWIAFVMSGAFVKRAKEPVAGHPEYQCGQGDGGKATHRRGIVAFRGVAIEGPNTPRRVWRIHRKCFRGMGRGAI